MGPDAQHATKCSRTPSKQHTAKANSAIQRRRLGKLWQAGENKSYPLCKSGSVPRGLCQHVMHGCCADACTVSGGYPERIAVTDKRKDPQDRRKGSVLERADKNTLVVRRAVVAQKLCRRAPCLKAPNIVVRIRMGVGEATGSGHTD